MTECDFCSDVMGVIRAVDPDGGYMNICANCMWQFDSFE
jgi:hypothetical protein